MDIRFSDLRPFRKSPTRLRTARLRRATAERVEPLEKRALLSGYGVVASLTGTAGQTPVGGVVVDSLGDIFGTAQASISQGTVWEVTAASIASNMPTTTLVHSFGGTANGGDGSTPDGDLIIDSHDNIFGTTKNGGANGNGAVFEISGASIGAGSPSVSIIASFSSAVGIAPTGGLLLQGSTLYGTASSGPTGAGVVYKLSTSGGPITDVVSFTGLGPEGSQPACSLVADSSGNLYGTTIGGGNGGTGDHGTVFEVNPNTNQLTTLYDFTNGTDGANPEGRLAIDSQGDLFGACMSGSGVSAHGSVFAITGSSIRSGAPSLQVLHDFDGADGIRPLAGVILDGTDLYGTTFGDRSASFGTLFEISAGSFTDVHTFTNDQMDGVQPDSDLYLADDGLIYGMTRFGGTGNAGALYSFSPSFVHGVSPSQLVFGQPPTTANVGANLSPAVTLKIEDSSGNLITSDNSTVTLSVSSGPSTALGGTLSVQAVGGIATFSDLSLPTRGTYTLQATDTADGLTSAPSNSFVVSSPGSTSSVTKLVFIQQPPQTAILNGPISTVEVAVEDAAGNIVTSDNSTVTISLGPLKVGEHGATLGGTLSEPIAGGIATFSDLTLDRDGAFTLVAKDGKLRKTTSSTFTIVPVLIWGQQPGLTLAGKKINPAVTIQLVDYNTLPALTDQSTVKISLANGPTGGKLSGPPSALMARVRNGVATFSKLTLIKAGAYSLQASDSLATPISSVNFGVTPAPPKKMIFSVLPVTLGANTLFEVVVQLIDPYVNLCTNNFSTVVLTLGIKPRGAVLGGTVIQQVSNGTAVFSDLTLTTPGAYTLTATDVDATPKAPAKSKLFRVILV